MKPTHRIGEALIRSGAISAEQLRQALDAQLVYGGHLGTCLIELGHLSEECLGRQLGELFDVPYADNSRFEEIPRSVVDAIPPGLAERCRAVPFALSDKLLRVAMVDPKNLEALDELAFASGYKLEPWVCPELRIFQALERFYDVPRRTRYITLCRELDRQGNESGELVLQPAFADAISAQIAAPAPTVAAPPTDGDARSTPADRPVERLTERLCRAESKNDLAQALLDAVEPGIDRAILFVVARGEASLWSWRGLDLKRQGGSGLRLPITHEPLFALLLGSLIYRGPVTQDARLRSFYERMATDVPAEILLIPIYVQDRMVAMFYGDAGRSGKIRGETESYARMMRKFAFALNMLYLKSKIRAA